MLVTKNPFASPSSQIEPSASAPESQPATSVVKAQVTHKQKQLAREKEEKARLRLTADLTEARSVREHARQTLGKRMGDGLDTSEAEASLTQAEETVSRLDIALRVAVQRVEAAQAQEKEAQAQVAIEAEVSVVAHARHVCRKVDQLIIEFERLCVDEVNPALNGAREVLVNSGIREGELNFLTELPLVLKQHVALAMCSTLREGFTPSTMMKYKQVSDCIPDDDFIRSRARPGPSTPKPIPGWQIGG